MSTAAPPAARRLVRLLAWVGVLLAALGGAGLLEYALANQGPLYAHYSVYASGLNNPRGLAFDSRGVLYVAEAGYGGDQQVIVAGYGSFKIGLSGRVSRIPAAGRRETFVDDLPSAFSSHHDDIGPAAVAVVGDDVYVLSAQGGNIMAIPGYSNTITRYRPDGSGTVIVDYSRFSQAFPSLARRQDPRADVPGGMPFGMTALNGRLYTTDGNLEFLQEFDTDGKPLRRIYEYPTSNRVMTGLTAGPDGALYVAEMGPTPYPRGSARVTRITTDGAASPAAEVLTTAIAAAFGRDGVLYVLEFEAPLRQSPNRGRLVKIVSRSQQQVVLAPLEFPTAMVTGPDGNLYVSNRGHAEEPRGGDGQILRVEIADVSPITTALDRLRQFGAAGLGGAGLLLCAAVGAILLRRS